MKLFSTNKLRGNWVFDNNKYGYDYCNAPYPEIIIDLKLLLTELIDSKLLIPNKIKGIEKELKYNTIDDIINIIIDSNLLENAYEFNITGETIIYTNKGEEVYHGIISLNDFRTFQQNFVLATYSDVWLPMAFDEDEYKFVWNIERFNLNYTRLVSLLNRLNHNLKWSNNSKEDIEYFERGVIQVGYELFLTKEVIAKEFELNPNNNFYLREYLLKISKLTSPPR